MSAGTSSPSNGHFHEWGGAKGGVACIVCGEFLRDRNQDEALPLPKKSILWPADDKDISQWIKEGY